MNKKHYHSELFKFAFFPNFDTAISFLADNLADEEVWDFSESIVNNNSILKIILNLHLDDYNKKKIVFTSDNKYACFNAGLVTENLEDIFAFLRNIKTLDRLLQHLFVSRHF